MTIFTIGHSTRPLEAFIDLLLAAKVDHLIDVRRFPVSKRHPQFNGKILSSALAKMNIGYTHMEVLGGRREARKDGKPSPHTLWREDGFRNYADYAETLVFRKALDALRLMETTTRPAIMCAEADWKNCHRQIIADYLLAAQVDVQHITDGKIEAARLTNGAIPRPDGTVLYSATPLLI